VIPGIRIAEGVAIETSGSEIVQPVEILRDKLIVRKLIMGELGAGSLIAAETIMGELRVHPVRGAEVVVCGDGIVSARELVSTSKIVRSGEIVAHGASRTMAVKSTECAGAHAVRREPVYAATRMETTTAQAETAARMETAATAHVEGAHAAAHVHTAHVHRAHAAAHVHTASHASAHVHTASHTSAHVHTAATTTASTKRERVAVGQTQSCDSGASQQCESYFGCAWAG
jgi:hypothetical protein